MIICPMCGVEFPDLDARAHHYAETHPDRNHVPATTHPKREARSLTEREENVGNELRAILQDWSVHVHGIAQGFESQRERERQQASKSGGLLDPIRQARLQGAAAGSSEAADALCEPRRPLGSPEAKTLALLRAMIKAARVEAKLWKHWCNERARQLESSSTTSDEDGARLAGHVAALRYLGSKRSTPPVTVLGIRVGYRVDLIEDPPDIDVLIRVDSQMGPAR